LWRMQVLVDRASRAQGDEEMDRFDDELLRALAGLRTLRERLGRETIESQGLMPSGVVEATPAVLQYEPAAGEMPAALLIQDDEEAADVAVPTARYNGRRVTARLEATR